MIEKKINKIKVFSAAIFSLFVLSAASCSDDSFLETIKEEEDFIAPYDILIPAERIKRTTYFPIPDSGSSSSIIPGDDGSLADTPRGIQLEVINNVKDNDDIVIDHVTGLTWTKCTMVADNAADTNDDCSGSDSSSTLEWSKAASTCKNLTYAGHKDWRLPRLPELLSTINYGYHPAIDPAVFPNTQVGYWTYSSKLMVDVNYNTADYGWVVYYHGFPLTTYTLKLKDDLTLEKQFARCVRGGIGDDDDIDE